MSFFNKVKWILGIALIFLVVVMTNLVDRQNFRIMSNSVETIYADRLVAKQIIFDIATDLHRKELLYVREGSSDLGPKLQTINASLQEDLAAFATTQLTPSEQQVFNQLRRQLVQIENYEMDEAIGYNSAEMNTILSETKNSLIELSDIQMKEGRRKKLESQRAIDYVNLFTQIEIGILILFAILIQVIILYTPKSSRIE